MSKWLAVVAFVLLVLSGATGLRNLVSAHAGPASSAPSILAQGGPIPPLPPPGGGH